MVQVPGDVLAWPTASGRWVVYNCRARKALGLSRDGLAALEAAAAGREPADEPGLAGRGFPLWRLSRFGNLDGLLADPSGFIRREDDWPPALELDAAGLAGELRQALMIIDDPQAYEARFQAKTSLLDGEHLGNFHQQLGQEVMLRKRQHPEKWWVEQKFTPDLAATRPDSLYDAVQAAFLRDYLPRVISPGQRVVDLGCGVGYFTGLMAQAGAQVLGVDPNQAYIDLASQRAPEGASFRAMAVGQPGGLSELPDDGFDLVFMSDALLLYFFNENPFVEREAQADLMELFGEIRRILAPGGRFINMEPHYLFWLAPWLGDPERPFTILAEYSHPRYRVTPSYGRLIQAYARGGFAVTWMEEVPPGAAAGEVDPRGLAFGGEFPLWQVFELAPLERS